MVVTDHSICSYDTPNGDRSPVSVVHNVGEGMASCVTECNEKSGSLIDHRNSLSLVEI